MLWVGLLDRLLQLSLTSHDATKNIVAARAAKARGLVTGNSRSISARGRRRSASTRRGDNARKRSRGASGSSGASAS